jgi:sugar/nucleoside kinase (ribokinase family)
MPPFVILGDLIADLYLGIESFPVQPGQHQNVSGLTLGPGGAGNAAVAAARLGLPVVSLGALGDDWVGAHVRAQLQAEGVDAGLVIAQPGEATSVAVILRAGDGEHVFLGQTGTRGPRELPAGWAAVLRAAGRLLVDGWAWRHNHPDVILTGVAVAAEARVPVLFDPGPLAGDLDTDWLNAILARAAVLLATEAEAETVARRLGLAGPEALAGAGRTVIVKRGAAGCRVIRAAEAVECAGYAVAVADLTAAGDCFAAAVAWGLAHGLPWGTIGALANAVGAAKVQKIGSALAAPTRAEVAAVLRRFRPDLLELWQGAEPGADAPRSRRAPRCEG